MTTRTNMQHTVDELHDIQGLLRSGYGALREASYLLLRIRDVVAAKTWLREVAVTSVADMQTRLSTAVHIAFTAAGLRALGTSEAIVAAFAPEFSAGIASGTRPRRLGDVGESAPEHWQWGVGAKEPHLLVMLFAEDGALRGMNDRINTATFQTAFAVTPLSSTFMNDHEPFGFRDGISQPVLDWSGERTPNTDDDLDYGNLIAAGEFLLGYVNEYGRYTDRPLLDLSATDAVSADAATSLPRAEDDPQKLDLGRNGSYLVFRQLDQDVRGLWRFLAAQGDRAEQLAEAMVGRRMSGESLLLIEPGVLRGVGPKAADITRNSFTYDQDAQGVACPFGAHVRRTNPRTGDMPGGKRGTIAKLAGMIGVSVGLTKRDARDDLIASSRFHRILRRGRPYGAYIEHNRLIDQGRVIEPVTPDVPSGLNFLCLNANIARQFEFVQSAWVVNSKFNGMDGEQDPLLGTRAPLMTGAVTDAFYLASPDGPRRCITGLPSFVTLRGGAYFFLPGLRALRFFAQ